jgi:hypothetical protein
MSQGAPADVLALILQQLHLVDFCAAAATCTMWHTAARKKAAWPKTIIGPLVFHVPLVCVPDARSLENTVWAACTNVTHHDSHNEPDALDLFGKWTEKVNKELLHVTDLSVLINSSYRDLNMRHVDSYRSQFERITSLHTNQVAFAQATSRERLVSLTIEGVVSVYDTLAWLNLIPTLASLTRIRVNLFAHEVRAVRAVPFGKAFAQLAHAHHTLRSIVLPHDCEMARYCLMGLLDPELSDLNLSSIHTLTNVPRLPGTIDSILTRIPHLIECMCAPYRKSWLPPLAKNDNHHHGGGLVSLSCNARDLSSSPKIAASCSNLAELDICDLGYSNTAKLQRMIRSYVRLTSLRLSDGHLVFANKNIGDFAPHLQQLSVCESAIWTLPTEGGWSVSICFAHLSTLAHLRHLELTHSCGFPGTDTNATRALLQGMVRSPCWRQVTCGKMPVAIRVDSNVFSSEQLKLVRWHVVDVEHGNQASITSYRPRLEASRWRTWVPGLQSHQVVWDRL